VSYSSSIAINLCTLVLAGWMSSIPYPGKADQVLSVQRDCCDSIQPAWLSWQAMVRLVCALQGSWHGLCLKHWDSNCTINHSSKYICCYHSSV